MDGVMLVVIIGGTLFYGVVAGMGIMRYWQHHKERKMRRYLAQHKRVGNPYQTQILVFRKDTTPEDARRLQFPDEC